LRRLGFTAGASLLGMLAGDDLMRLVASGLDRQRATQGIASALAQEFRSAGVAMAQGTYSSYCGVQNVLCSVCPVGENGLPIGPCACSPYSGPCLSCTPPSDCEDCFTVADYKFCNCKQAALNAYPGCANCSGTPNGTPDCNTFNNMTTACSDQYRYDTTHC